MKQWISIFLLFSFALVNLPKEWLHHCDHEVLVHHEDSEHLEEDCAMCDFEFAPYSPSHVEALAFVDTCFSDFISLSSATPVVEEISLNKGRAPPVMA